MALYTIHVMEESVILIGQNVLIHQEDIAIVKQTTLHTMGQLVLQKVCKTSLISNINVLHFASPRLDK